MTPAPCTNPPDVPCRPDCRGWVVVGEVIDVCPACEHWAADHEGMLAAVSHVCNCPACADLAVEAGAIAPLFAVLEGLRYDETPRGWVASLYSTVPGGGLIVSTAAYPAREDARAAGMAWLRRLRGT